ncbi:MULTISPECIES: hypothetical protein [unclassified Apibacter]|uniref:hypothetical protein n=1 Tax=unclassified Apibacter TaxID=2630820 RepID=UPI00136AACAF|nr:MULTISPECIES: hypothetical protein [unclassified Apibacter]
MYYLKKIYIILIIIFLIIFPKGGFKFGDIPITWGYVLLIISIPLCILGKIRFINKNRYYVFILTLPFIIYSFIILILRMEKIDLAYTLSFCLSILILPFVFLILYDNILDSDMFNKTFPRIFFWGIRIVIIFGLLLFFCKLCYGINIEIPYLTVNIDDNMEDKNNNRSGISKLYSTYNNGNLYGICMIILAPLFFKYEKNNIYRCLFFISLFLTLSRTIWIGIIIYFIIYIFKNFIKGKNILIILLIVISLIIGFPYLLRFMNKDISFIMDSNLGGRRYQLNFLKDASLFGHGSFKGIVEIVYLSIIDIFGVIGLLLFILYLASPIIVYKIKKNNSNLYWGLILYSILCLSDGAILLIPVMSFYWFISSYMFKNTETDIEIDGS